MKSLIYVAYGLVAVMIIAVLSVIGAILFAKLRGDDIFYYTIGGVVVFFLDLVLLIATWQYPRSMGSCSVLWSGRCSPVFHPAN